MLQERLVFACPVPKALQMQQQTAMSACIIGKHVFDPAERPNVHLCVQRLHAAAWGPFLPASLCMQQLPGTLRT